MECLLGNNTDGGLHVVVAGAAELVAGELEVPGADRLEPDPSDRAAGDAVLVEPKFGDVEGVDHVSCMQQHMDGAPDGDHQLGGDHILSSAWILGVSSPSVCRGDFFHVHRRQLPADSGIAHFPAELVAGDVDCQRVLRGGTMDLLPDAVAVNGERKEDDRWQRGPDDLKGVVAVAVMRRNSRTPTISNEVVSVGSLDKDEDHGREPEDDLDDEVDLEACCRDAGWEAVDISSALLGHQSARHREQK